LLCSLFHLFTELIEQTIDFAEAIAMVPRSFKRNFTGQEALIKVWAISRQYLRKGVLIATWALFILSSLEWTRPLQRYAAPEVQSVVTSTEGTTTTQAFQAEYGSMAVATPLSLNQPSPSPSCYIRIKASPPRRWLLLCTLRL
jgi:hypothetical protein